MKTYIKYIAIVLIFTGFFSCDMFEPIDENRITTEYVGTDPESAEGVLLQAYNGLINQYSFSEAATDDAVNNQLSSGYKRMATGELTAQYNPANRWNRYERVLYINKFIDILEAGNVQWSRDEDINTLFGERLRGEAYALRAAYHMWILQTHAGIGSNGQLLGVPYITEFIASDGDFNTPRLSFEAMVTAINDDLEEAVQILPFDYSDDIADVPPVYAGYEHDKYKVAFGSQYNLRVSGRIAKALQARLALFAGSPSFLNGNGDYETAAAKAAEVLNTIGGIDGLVEGGHIFYDEDSDKDSGELLWRASIGNNSSSREEDEEAVVAGTDRFESFNWEQ